MKYSNRDLLAKVTKNLAINIRFVVIKGYNLECPIRFFVHFSKTLMNVRGFPNTSVNGPSVWCIVVARGGGFFPLLRGLSLLTEAFYTTPGRGGGAFLGLPLLQKVLRAPMGGCECVGHLDSSRPTSPVNWHITQCNLGK